MSDREIVEGEKIIECRNCGSEWSVITSGQIFAVLLKCPLCERKEEGC